MKLVVATVAVVTTALAASVGTAIGRNAPRSTAVHSLDRPAATSKPSPRPKARSSSTVHPSYRTTGARGISTAALNSVIETYCQDCHNENLMTGNLSLENFDVAAADKKLAISEKMIRKLRAEMMPLPGAPRPTGDTLKALVETMEEVIDRRRIPIRARERSSD
jgi:hypothetical protein